MFGRIGRPPQACTRSGACEFYWIHPSSAAYVRRRLALPSDPPPEALRPQRAVERPIRDGNRGGRRLDRLRPLHGARRSTRPASGYYTAGSAQVRPRRAISSPPPRFRRSSRARSPAGSAPVLRQAGSTTSSRSARAPARSPPNCSRSWRALGMLPAPLSHPRNQRGAARAPARAPRPALRRHRRRVARRAAAPRSRGVVIGNEVLDAMPVHVIRTRADGHRRAAGSWPAGDGFAGSRAPAAGELLAAAQCARAARPAIRREIGLAARGFVRHARRLRSSAAPHCSSTTAFRRASTTIRSGTWARSMCHYRHRSHDDPFFLPGLQDITATSTSPRSPRPRAARGSRSSAIPRRRSSS